MGAYGNTEQASKSALYPLTVNMTTSDSMTLPSDAKWYLDNQDSTLYDSGQAVMVQAGNHTIHFVINIGTPYMPSNMSITVTSSSTNNYSAIYNACGYLTVRGKYANGCGYSYGNWSVNDGLGQRNGAGQQKVLTGTGYTITFNSAGSQYTTPNPISNVTVTKGSTATYDRDYILTEINVDGQSGNDTTNTGTPTCPVKTIKKAFEMIPANGGTIFVCCPSVFYEYSITFPTDRTIYMYGQYANPPGITVHTCSSPPLNIIYSGYGIQFTCP
jgi:hypothetical protein